MKKFLVLCFILIGLLFSNNTLMATEWENLGSAGFTSNQADFTSMAIDGNNVPYVVYKDNVNTKATVMKFDVSNWVLVGSAAFSTGRVDYTNIAIDGNNVPYVVYKDVAAPSFGKATVKKFDGSSWVTLGSAGFSAGRADYTDIAIDGNNVPYVVYWDGANSNKATVKKFNGSSWVTVGSAGFSAGQADHISIAIDENNVPYVVYKDGGNSGKATVMKFDGSSWVTLGSAGFSAGEAKSTQIAIDRNNVPYVVYMDMSNSTCTTVMKFDGSSWVMVGGASVSAGGSSGQSIAIDGNNVPYVVYYDGDNSTFKATAKKFDGSSWVTAGSRGFSADITYYNGIVIDGNNVPYVVYQDVGNSKKATVMKFDILQPTVQSKSITYHSITKDRIGLRWTKGNGDNRLIIASTNSLSGNIDYIDDKIVYQAGDFGTYACTTNVYGVYNGNNTTCLVYGLSRNTTYYFRILEYNFDGDDSNYLLNTASGNPSSKKTNKKESDEIDGENVISIYPNPVKDVLNIDLKNVIENAKLIIINEVGQEVYSTTNTNNLLTINTLDFANGVYHIIITNDDESIYHSFVIER
jgi:hypothetical protein